MNIPQIMSTMSLLRKQIFDEHVDLSYYKGLRTSYSQMSDQSAATDCHKLVVKYRRSIKRLVALQSALKADYRQALSLQRASRLVSSGWLKNVIIDEAAPVSVQAWGSLAKTFEAKRATEAKGKAAKEAAMDFNGEVV